MLFQPRPGSNYNPPPVMIGDHPLSYVSNFKYLGSFLLNNATVDANVSHRISKASATFAKLYNRLWQRHEIKLTTKVAVYKAVVLSVLLYGCESWTLLRRNLKSLESFHLRCLRRICGIQWTDYIPSTEVLSRCNLSGIESFVMKCQFGWAGHMSRMPNDRIPKQLLLVNWNRAIVINLILYMEYFMEYIWNNIWNNILYGYCVFMYVCMYVSLKSRTHVSHATQETLKSHH